MCIKSVYSCRACVYGISIPMFMCFIHVNFILFLQRRQLFQFPKAKQRRQSKTLILDSVSGSLRHCGNLVTKNFHTEKRFHIQTQQIKCCYIYISTYIFYIILVVIGMSRYLSQKLRSNKQTKYMCMHYHVLACISNVAI